MLIQRVVVAIFLILIAMFAVANWRTHQLSFSRPSVNSFGPPGPLRAPSAPQQLPIQMEMVRIEPGTFMMGDPADAGTSSTDYPHQVTLTKPFLIGKYKVTVADFTRFADETHYQTSAERTGKGYVHADRSEYFKPQRGLTWRNAFPDLPDTVPVVCVSWYDARAFCSWMQKRTGKITRLPTESEWEYACRAGTDSRFNVDAPVEELGWFARNSGDHSFDDYAAKTFAVYKTKVQDEHCRPHPVGQKTPNAWGLYDMHGNVWEWVYDINAPYPNHPVTDPIGSNKSDARDRIARGGDYWDQPSIATSFNRGWWVAQDGYYHIGFRVVQEP